MSHNSDTSEVSTATATVAAAVASDPVKRSPLQRVKALAGKASAVAAGMTVSASAFAQASDIPTDLAGAVAFMQTKGGIAVGVAAVITLIILGITGAKLPRRGS